MKYEEAKTKAQQQSAESHAVQHVNRDLKGDFYVSDWFDSDSTFVSYHNGEWNSSRVDIKYPDYEELDADDWKVLFMVLCENRGEVDLEKGLTDHGKRLLHAVQRKIGINAVGVDISANTDAALGLGRFALSSDNRPTWPDGSEYEDRDV